MKAVIDDPSCTHEAKSVGTVGGLIFGRKYEEQSWTNVANEYPAGGPDIGD
jgi:hypothetical protein